MNSIDFPEAPLLPVLCSDGWEPTVKEGYRKTILKIQTKWFFTIAREGNMMQYIVTASFKNPQGHVNVIPDPHGNPNSNDLDVKSSLRSLRTLM